LYKPTSPRSLLRDRQEQLELWRKLLFRIQPVAEVQAADAAICVDLNSQGLNVVRAVCSTCEVGKIELDLIPPFVEAHGHGANEWLHSGGGLVIARAEPSADVLVIKNLDFEREILLQVLDDHD